MNSTLEPMSRPGGWPVDAPPRSPVFGMAPQGYSGDTIEELGSYFRRLAAEHGLLPWTLAYCAVAPLICGRDFKGNRDVADDCYSPAVNGVTELAARWSYALNKLTLRHDLQLRTLLPLRHILSHYRLISAAERFCPACYSDDELAGRQKYNRLLWSIDCVTACPVHGLVLKPVPRAKRGCGKPFWLPGLSRVDGASLAYNVADKAQPHEIRIARLIVELLDDSHQRPDSFRDASAIPTFLRHATDSLFNGHAANFAAHLGISKSELHGWMTGNVCPSLHRIVLVASCCDCTVTDVLLGNKVMLKKRERPFGEPISLSPRRLAPARPVDVLTAELEEIIQFGTASCLRDAANTLGVTPKYLRKKAPKQAALIVKRGEQLRQSVVQATDAAKFGEYLNSFRALRAQGVSTARRNVIRDVRERTGMTFGYAEAMRFQHKAQEASEPAECRK
jgi:TniQ